MERRLVQKEDNVDKRAEELSRREKEVSQHERQINLREKELGDQEEELRRLIGRSRTSDLCNVNAARSQLS